MRAAPISSLMLAGLVLLPAVLVAQVSLPLLSPVSAEEAACPRNPDPPDRSNPSVIVNTPVAGQRVTSPVLISGRAAVFEAVVSITIFDASGRAIVNTTTMTSEGFVLSPFSKRVPFTVSREQAGCIRVFEASAKDGSPTNVVQVEVILAPGPRPPSTGDGGLADLGSEGRNELLSLGAAASISVLLGFGLLRRLRTWRPRA
jgi:Immunoglobulin-like domain of bacterial spore germination